MEKAAANPLKFTIKINSPVVAPSEKCKESRKRKDFDETHLLPCVVDDNASRNKGKESRKRKVIGLDQTPLVLLHYDSNPSEVLDFVTTKKGHKSRKREEIINLDLCLYNHQSCFNKNTHEINNILVDSEASPEEFRVAKRLKSLRVYGKDEETEEMYFGVSTQLQLFSDPWRIRKVLTTSDCNHLCRLMLGKELVQQNIINVWNQAHLTDAVAKIRTKDGVGVKVWDCERGKEYELTFKNLPSSECYVFGHNWSAKFVRERGLKKGDEIGMYWSNNDKRFVFSLLACAPPAL